MVKRIFSALILVSMILPLIAAFGVIGTVAADVDPKGVYVTPTGAGTKDGSSWANALAGDEKGALTAAWDKTPGDGTLYIGAGEYTVPQTMTIASGGTSLDSLKKIVGVSDGEKRPQFTGDYEKMADVDKGTNFIVLKEGVKFIQIENLVVNHYSYVVYTEGLNEGLRFYNIDMNYICDGFYMDGHSTKDGLKGNKDIIIDGTDAYWFRKRVVRFRRGNSDAVVSNVTGDAGGKEAWRTGNWPVGVAFEANDPNIFEERITVTDSTFSNCYQESADPVTGYWNSDGISGERTSRDLTFIRCNAYSTTDAGWDLKTTNPTLIDCVAMDNKRNFKFWALEQATLINCLAAYAKTKGGIGIDCGIIANGGKKDTTDPTGNAKIVAYNSTFYNNTGTQLQGEGGTFELYNCIVGTDDPKNFLTNDEPGYQNNSYNFYNTLLYVKGANKADEDPQFKNPSAKLFDGKSDDWNSLKYNGSIGYHYDPNKLPAIYSADPKGYGVITDMTQAYSWAEEAVNFMTLNDYLPGRAKTVFGPGYNLTRAEFATMLVRTLGLKSDKTETFTDVPAGFIYAADIGTAKAAGVVMGYENGEFKPMDSISRQDVMVMLSRALKIAGKLPNDYNAALSAIDAFFDKGIIYDYAKQDVANMVEKEIIKGGTDGTINPLGNTTRAEGAVIGKRIYDLK